MVTTRDFNASTTRQSEAVDALLKCGFYPSKIRLNGYEVEMRYYYKYLNGEDSLLSIIVGPSGNYELVNNYGLRNETSETFTLKSLIGYLQMLIACGCKFDFQDKGEKNHKEDNKVTAYTMNDAVSMVLSDDYKKRFIAEYVETKIRYERLHNIIIKWCAGKADFVTDIELLEEQAKYMGNYLKVLEIRAVKEDIELPDVVWRN